MKRTIYKHKGIIVAIVDESPWNAECAFLRYPDGSFQSMSAHDAHTLAQLAQLTGNAQHSFGGAK